MPGEQHHERVTRLGLGWYAGNITKYAERAPHKGQQIDDLIKVLDYTVMWICNDQKSINPLKINDEQRTKIVEVMDKLLEGIGLMKVVSQRPEQNDPSNPYRDMPGGVGGWIKPGYGSVLSNDSGEGASPAYVNQDRSKG